MKKLLALFLLIVALSVAAPGFLGMQAEARYDAVVAQLQAAGYRVADRTYARGWFSSSARLQLEVRCPRAAPRTRRRCGDDQDPCPARALPRRPRAAVRHRRLDSEVWLDSEPLIVGDGAAPVRTLVGFLGSAKTIVAVPARQLTSRAAPGNRAGEWRAQLRGRRAPRGGELSMPFASLQGNAGVAARVEG